MQLVFEFGSSRLSPIIESIRRAIGPLRYSIEAVPKDGDTNQPTDETLEIAAQKLESGRTQAFTVRPVGEEIRYALVLSPNYDKQPLSLYLGTIEYTGASYGNIWELLLATPGLSVVCLGYEEGVELTDANLTVKTFPWNDWPLVLGALCENEAWTIRDGPEITKVQPQAQ